MKTLFEKSIHMIQDGVKRFQKVHKNDLMYGFENLTN